MKEVKTKSHKLETIIEGGQIIIKSRYDLRNSIKIESHEYAVNSERNYKIEYRFHSTNGYDSWNAERKYFSLVEAIKTAQLLVSNWDKEYEQERK